MKNTYTRREFLSMAGLSAVALALSACSGLDLSKEDEDGKQRKRLMSCFLHLKVT